MTDREPSALAVVMIVMALVCLGVWLLDGPRGERLNRTFRELTTASQ